MLGYATVRADARDGLEGAPAVLAHELALGVRDGRAWETGEGCSQQQEEGATARVRWRACGAAAEARDAHAAQRDLAVWACEAREACSQQQEQPQEGEVRVR